MSYNILGINPFHNGSVCVLSDGEIVYFLEEERLTKFKYDANPFRVVLEVLNKFKIDEVVLGGINSNDGKLPYEEKETFTTFIRKLYPKNTLPITYLSDNHHLTHINHTYFNSGFDEALGIIIDGGGSTHPNLGIEVDSVYKCSPSNINHLYSKYNLHNEDKPVPLNAGIAYLAVSLYLGFKPSEEGKTMGLSSYGNQNPNITTFLKEGSINPITMHEISVGKKRNIQLNPEVFPKPKFNSQEYSQHDKDLAWRLQKDTQQLVGDYIEKYIKETGVKQVCCAGGYFLNCVANYYLTKRFPDVEFYFEPISHDGGTAIGAAYHRWKEINPKFKLKKQKSIYYGPKYPKGELLKGIQKYT